MHYQSERRLTLVAKSDIAHYWRWQKPAPEVRFWPSALFAATQRSSCFRGRADIDPGRSQNWIYDYTPYSPFVSEVRDLSML
jgi:hypothetical protein